MFFKVTCPTLVILWHHVCICMIKHELTLHKVGPGLQPPDNLSFLSAVHPSVLTVPHVGRAGLIWKRAEPRLRHEFVLTVGLDKSRSGCFDISNQRMLNQTADDGGWSSGLHQEKKKNPRLCRICSTFKFSLQCLSLISEIHSQNNLAATSKQKDKHQTSSELKTGRGNSAVRSTLAHRLMKLQTQLTGGEFQERTAYRILCVCVCLKGLEEGSRGQVAYHWVSA